MNRPHEWPTHSTKPNKDATTLRYPSQRMRRPSGGFRPGSKGFNIPKTHITSFSLLSNKSQRVSKYGIVKERDPFVAKATLCTILYFLRREPCRSHGNQLSYVVFATNKRTLFEPISRTHWNLFKPLTMHVSCFHNGEVKLRVKVLTAR